MRNRIAALLALSLALSCPALAQDKPAQTPQPPAQTPQNPAQPAAAENAGHPEIIFSGKLYCSPKYTVVIPYAATITAMRTDLGKKVKYDDVLAEYEIPFEIRIDEKKKLTLAGIKDLEAKLAQAGRELENLRGRRKELETLRTQKMASDQAITGNAEDIEVLEKQRAAITESLALERDLFQIQQDMARDQLGVQNATAKDVPKTGLIRAPLDGYVVWMNPDLRKNAYMIKNSELFQIGVMDPIMLRALVHEIEAQKIRVGDEGAVTFESLPGKTFKAAVSRIPWAPLSASLQQPSYYEVEMTMANPELVLKEGLKGLVTIVPKK
ncbi:MAG: efflux RND transporter periplasmic adaptor subunit [Desulfovibrionaceae bacterium]|nr:efflux RND transporter periplasmic adaptor subunit [Desulfovibrionaceae bacterium]MBF0514588.1 efflux RND transporter periplasmic adaptor subunit [Desulfovibrionaceae bacterium]